MAKTKTKTTTSKPTSLKPRPKGYKPEQDYYVYNGQIYGVANGNRYSGTESYKMPDGRVIEIKTGGFQPYDGVKGGLLRQDVAGPFQRMLEAAKQDGITLNTTTADGMFRDFKTQQATRKKAEDKGTPEMAAKAGYSSHGNGRALDFDIGVPMVKQPNYNVSPKSAWLNANANNYGFYAPADMYATAPEPWHYEYNPDLDPVIQNQKNAVAKQRLDISQPAMNLATQMGTLNFAQIPQAVITANKPGYWTSLQNTNNEYNTEQQTNADLDMLRSGKAKKIKSNTTT